MKSSTKILALMATSILLLAQTATAQQGPKPERFVKWRQSAFQLIAYNTGRIKASLDGNLNKDEVAKSAAAIAAIANTGLEKLFPVGTEKTKGWEETEVKPEAFKDIKHFTEYGNNLAKEASELATVANGGDAAAIKAQFGKMTKVCKACHDDFKAKD